MQFWLNDLHEILCFAQWAAHSLYVLPYVHLSPKKSSCWSSDAKSVFKILILLRSNRIWGTQKRVACSAGVTKSREVNRAWRVNEKWRMLTLAIHGLEFGQFSRDWMRFHSCMGRLIVPKLIHRLTWM